ncbi:Quinone oxidoreductase-like protein 1 [Hondaea fermentalgiana]|uniref:Quinone oxidoreductase-like protein 1 n=1 Tax=Hondaea fermentalgiana TaxID=2315210 RepID=A0A2R5GGW3_9STRA|nr:Quinone oxidoreductase-like protein 1 [Hondaea fermentalgiana]|eukprot:GBG28998.1 Quinone oxidoreductase-like protein 1 [Hondaea fermentalgiana]
MMMRAAVVKAYGKAENVVAMVSDFAAPTCEQDKMLVRVRAGALNAGDAFVFSGRARMLLAKQKFPYVLAGDICGVVEEVGPTCAGNFKVGDEIVAEVEFDSQQGLAEIALVDPARAVLKPKRLSAVEAAALPTAGMTAMAAFEKAKIQQGERVLVLGGSGGIGTIALQLAKSAGASFVATTSRNADFVSELGADHVVDYTKENWWEVLTDMDVVIDCIGDDAAMTNCHQVFRKNQRGRFVTVNPAGLHSSAGSFFETAALALGVMGRIVRQKMRRNAPTLSTIDIDVSSEALETVMAAVEAGKFTPVLDPSGPFPFTEKSVKDAAIRLEQHRAKGKIVIEISEADMAK